LTFLGKRPYEGGKLTKILVLSRKLSAKNLIEAVRSSVNTMTPMPDLATVESAATKVSRQMVKVNIEDRHQLPPGTFLRWMAPSLVGPKLLMQFINETDFPMKVVSGKVGWFRKNLEFVQDVQPHSSYLKGLQSYRYLILSTGFPHMFSAGGYLTIYLNGILSSDIEPPAGASRIIESALWHAALDPLPVISKTINIQDKTIAEFTLGQDTYNAMKSGEAKTLYWFDRGVHYMTRAEIVEFCFFFGVVIW